MTRIKVLSVLAVAFVLTAFGATSAFAWEGVTIHERQACGDDVLKVFATDAKGFLHSHGAPASGSLTVKDSHGDTVAGTFTWTFDKHGGTTQQIGTVPLADLKAGETYTVTLDNRDDVVTTPVTIETCPTPTPTPTEKPHASSTPTATAQPTATATASVQASSSAVPSPPVTGQGAGGSGDNKFGIVLLVMVLGTVAIGGTTLALSRKGS